jgi:hypothetical protein
MTTRPSRKQCFYCERQFGDIPINGVLPLKKTADHIHPVSKGGTRHELNIIPACNKCNSLKGNKTLEEFEQLLTEWIEAGYQTRNGYTLELLKIMKHKVKKLYHFRSGYTVIMSVSNADSNTKQIEP